MTALFSTSYFPPVSYFIALAECKNAIIDIHEHFPKQTWRNRCTIYSPNGAQNLIVPINDRKDKTPTAEIKISYADRWQTNHWRSIEAAYRKSPYFEFYEDGIKPLFGLRHENLIDLNNTILKLLLSTFEMSCETTYTLSYEKQSKINDFRPLLSKTEMQNRTHFARYAQTFEDRFGFIANLSSLDVLFNLGPQSKSYFISQLIKKP